MFFSRVLPVLFAASSLVQALSVSTHVDDYFFTEFLNSLNEHNLTHVAESYKKAAETEEGKVIVDTLKYGGELTILAPEDEAFGKDDTCLDPDLIKYNILLGNVDKNFISSDSYHQRRGASKSHSTARSTFRRKNSKVEAKRDNDKGGVNFDIEKLQVQVVDQFVNDENWKRWNVEREILIDRPVGNSKVVDRFNFKKIIVLIIDAVLSLPPKVSELLCKPLIKDAPNGFKKVLEALQKTGLIDSVDNRDEITAFVPVDSSFSDGDHESDYGLADLVKNHYFFGKIVYTTLFGKIKEATSESGKQLRFTFENDIHYVCCGESKAVILRGDVVAQTGVIHIIDRPLVC